MVIAQDTTNLHFDDVFVIYSNNFEYGVSCTDYIYFSEEVAQKTADEMNETYAFGKDKRFMYYVASLTEYIEKYGEGKHDEGEGGERASMSFND